MAKVVGVWPVQLPSTPRFYVGPGRQGGLEAQGFKESRLVVTIPSFIPMLCLHRTLPTKKPGKLCC